MNNNNTQKRESGEKEYGWIVSTIGSANIWVVHGIAAMVAVTIIGVLFTTTATATTEYVVLENGDDAGFICDDEGEPTFLGDILSTMLDFILIATVPVFILLYQLDGLMEFFALGADTKMKIKKHQRNMWVGAAKVFLAPTVVYLVASALDIGIPACIGLDWWN